MCCTCVAYVVGSICMVIIVVGSVEDEPDSCSTAGFHETRLVFGLRLSRDLATFMYGFYYHFNNLRFNKPQHINDLSAAQGNISFISSDILKWRLLKWLSDHPMRHVSSMCTSAYAPLRTHLCSSPGVRPITALRLWISEGLTQTMILHFKEWNSQAHGELSRKSWVNESWWGDS